MVVNPVAEAALKLRHLGQDLEVSGQNAGHGLTIGFAGARLLSSPRELRVTIRQIAMGTGSARVRGLPCREALLFRATLEIAP